MKGLVFVLLAANLALAAFVYVRDNSPNPDAQILQQQLNAEQIRTVAPRPPPPAPVAAAPSAGMCMEWGNFAAVDTARAQAALEAIALGSRSRRTEVPVTTSYWIFIPPLKSRLDMDRKSAELRALGVTEYAPILEPGRWRYAISLGVFRTEDAAGRHLAMLRAKGVRSAQLGEREQRITQNAFVIRDPSAAQLASLRADYPATELRAVDCPPSDKAR